MLLRPLDNRKKRVYDERKAVMETVSVHENGSESGTVRARAGVWHGEHPSGAVG